MSQTSNFRIAKDEYFANSGGSPLTQEQKSIFSSLKYYKENKDLIFQLPVKEFARKETLAIPTTSGTVSTYTRWGKVEFKVYGSHVELTMFQDTNGPSNEFFVPFKDETTGHETYHGGRYLQPHPTSGRKIILDFNYSCNPYCAYNSRWTCPIVPVENILRIPIHAGEKFFN